MEPCPLLDNLISEINDELINSVLAGTFSSTTQATSMSTHLVQPYTDGKYDLRLFLDTPTFWQNYKALKRRFFLSWCIDSMDKEFINKMQQFCSTCDPEEFVELYGNLLLMESKHIPEETMLKYSKGLEKVKNRHSLNEVAGIVRSYGYDVDSSAMGTGYTDSIILAGLASRGVTARVIIMTPARGSLDGFSTSAIRRSPHIPIQERMATLQTLPALASSSHPSDKKKERRQRIREQQIRTGQRRR